MKTTKVGIFLACIGLALSPALAQVQVDRSVPANASGEVSIENAFGPVTVIGWDQNEVKITGTLAASAEGLDVEGDDEGVWIEVEVPDSWFYRDQQAAEFDSRIEVRVPRGSSVEIETVNGNVEVTDVEGAVSVETVNGTIAVRGNPREVEIETMTGSVEVEAVAAEIAIEAVSAPVTVRGASGAVGIESVAGDVLVEGTALGEVEVETVSANVELRGSVASQGAIEIESHSGNVDLYLGGVKARFELETFSGTIDNSLGPAATKPDPHMPGQRLRFATGSDAFEIYVGTFSGNITLHAGS